MSLPEHVMEEYRKSKSPVGRVHSMESFGLVDGPGVRFVVFLQGCQMRCQYCHNPETWDQKGGSLWTPKELFDRVYGYRKYWGQEGGITVSGGEPLLQVEFVSEFFRLAKQYQVHTALDTSGGPFTKQDPFFGKFQKLMENTDLVLLDLKQIDETRHKRLTGRENGNIMEMARYLSGCGKDLWIRHVLVPTITDHKEDLIRLRDFIRQLETVRRVEVLPYHNMGEFKWKELGIPYSLKEIQAPTKQEVKEAEEILEVSRYTN